MIEKKVIDTIKNYRLFTKPQRILVAASGGKDSTVLLYILKKYHYNFEAVYVDAGIESFTDKTKQNLTKFCNQHSIKLNIITFKQELNVTLPEILSKLKKYHSCTICGVLRRYLINKYARRHKFKAVATGHNLDDEAQATLMNIFRDDYERFLRQGPVSGIVKSKEFIPRVKPLYFVKEKDILKYAVHMKFPIHYERCPYSYGVYRDSVKRFLRSYENQAENIVAFTLKHLPKKEHTKIRTCKICGEPSNTDICKTCQILQEVKNAGISG